MTSFVTFISSTDPAAFVAVTLLLVMIALWACYVPARRAMRVGSQSLCGMNKFAFPMTRPTLLRADSPAPSDAISNSNRQWLTTGTCRRCQGRGDSENLADGSTFSIVHEESPFPLNRSGGQILSVSVVFWQLERQWPWKRASLQPGIIKAIEV